MEVRLPPAGGLPITLGRACWGGGGGVQCVRGDGRTLARFSVPLCDNIHRAHVRLSHHHHAGCGQPGGGTWMAVHCKPVGGNPAWVTSASQEGERRFLTAEPTRVSPGDTVCLSLSQHVVRLLSPPGEAQQHQQAAVAGATGAQSTRHAKAETVHTVAKLAVPAVAAVALLAHAYPPTARVSAPTKRRAASSLGGHSYHPLPKRQASNADARGLVSASRGGADGPGAVIGQGATTAAEFVGAQELGGGGVGSSSSSSSSSSRGAPFRWAAATMEQWNSRAVWGLPWVGCGLAGEGDAAAWAGLIYQRVRRQAAAAEAEAEAAALHAPPLSEIEVWRILEAQSDDRSAPVVSSLAAAPPARARAPDVAAAGSCDPPTAADVTDALARPAATPADSMSAQIGTDQAQCRRVFVCGDANSMGLLEYTGLGCQDSSAISVGRIPAPKCFPALLKDYLAKNQVQVVSHCSAFLSNENVKTWLTRSDGVGLRAGDVVLLATQLNDVDLWVSTDATVSGRARPKFEMNGKDDHRPKEAIDEILRQGALVALARMCGHPELSTSDRKNSALQTMYLRLEGDYFGKPVRMFDLFESVPPSAFQSSMYSLDALHAALAATPEKGVDRAVKRYLPTSEAQQTMATNACRVIQSLLMPDSASPPYAPPMLSDPDPRFCLALSALGVNNAFKIPEAPATLTAIAAIDEFLR
jgi:hypothetical protein